MNYEYYKKFFNGSFFPVTDPNHLVNMESTGEFSVKSITGSGENAKTVNHYLPSTIGLTNMLNGFTGGSRFEALSSHSNYFIPEIFDCDSYSGVQKAIVNYFKQKTENPIIIKTDNLIGTPAAAIKAGYETVDYVIDWGDGTEESGHLEVNQTLSHQYKNLYKKTIKIYTQNEGFIVSVSTPRFTIISPVFTNYTANVNGGYFATKTVMLKNVQTVTINANSGTVITTPNTLQFGSEGNAVNINSGIADFTNLSSYADTLTDVNLYCRNLYFDWSDLTFKKQVTIKCYPDELTIKTTADYFARQDWTTATKKPIFTVLKGGAQDKWYNYLVENYSDKFASITKEE